MLSTASYIKSYRPLSMDTPLDTGAPRYRRRFPCDLPLHPAIDQSCDR